MIEPAQRSYDLVIVGGLGHVGLPLGIAFARAGLKVCLYDIDAKKAESARKGTMPFLEYDAEPVLREVVGRTLFISSQLAQVSEAQYVIVALGTPIDEYLNPRLKLFFELFETLIPHLRTDQTIIIRSTVYPKICEEVDRFLKKRGLAVRIAYCPERIIQGYALRELSTLPQIVAGLTPDAEQRAVDLFSRLSPKVVRTKMGEAELIKLFANAWRYIQFAITNQFYMIATHYGEDYEHLRKAMMDGYGRAAQLPSAGFAAGPCLLKDTMQLASFTLNTFQLGHAAMAINEGLPNFIVDQLRKTHDLSKRTVGILGMAFKANIDDIRDSLSYKLRKVLKFHGAEVVCSDHYVPDPEFVSKEELLRRSDIVIIGAPHDEYKNLVVQEQVELVDIWGFVERTGRSHGN